MDVSKPSDALKDGHLERDKIFKIIKKKVFLSDFNDQRFEAIILSFPLDSNTLMCTFLLRWHFYSK